MRLNQIRHAGLRKLLQSLPTIPSVLIWRGRRLPVPLIGVRVAPRGVCVLKKLATGAPVGCSRPRVDAGW